MRLKVRLLIFCLSCLLLGYSSSAQGQSSSTLEEAVLSNNEFTVKNFLKSNTFERDQLNSVLAVAVYRALSPQIVRVLIAAGADPHAGDGQGNSLLIAALTPPTLPGSKDLKSATLVPLGPRRLTLLKILLQLGIDPDLPSKNGDTPLIYAAARGEVDAVRELLSHKANPNLADWHGRTALYHSARKDFTEVVVLLLRRGADPNLTDIKDRSPLMAAAAAGSLDSVRILAKSGADLNIKDAKKHTALSLARKYRRRQVSTLLRRLGAKASKSNQYDASETGGPLNNPFIAISSNNIEALRSIVSRGINLEPTNVAGNTPLLEAAKLDRLMMSRILIKGGARVNVRSSKGWTPLMFAAQRGNHALARDLLDAGAIPDVINPQGMTAMDLAEKHGYMDVAVFIRRHITRSKRR